VLWIEKKMFDHMRSSRKVLKMGGTAVLKNFVPTFDTSKATWGISPTVILVIRRFLSNFNRSSISGMDEELHIPVPMRLPC
jgi:hypothetical protein